MKRLIAPPFVSVTLGILLLLTPGVASAHVLKENHGIAAVLHMPPDDNPQANEPTELNFSFGDPTNAFQIQDCDCRVTIKDGAKVVTRVVPKPALEGATLDSTVKVTFLAAGVYDVVVDGTAKNHAFQTFQLDYPVRVTGGTANYSRGQNGSEILIIAAGSLVILTMIAYSNMQTGGRYITGSQVTLKSNKKE